MKLIFVKNKIQTPETPNPDIIDGEILSWECRPIKVRRGEYFTEWLERIQAQTKYEIKYLIISDIISIKDHFCDQGCLPGTGCKSQYIEAAHDAMLVIACKIPIN